MRKQIFLKFVDKSLAGLPKDRISDQNLRLFRSLFWGREDVFAIRWEKGGKSGYMPAYHFDPYFYRTHKMKGGTFKDFLDKSYLPFTDEKQRRQNQ